MPSTLKKLLTFETFVCQDYVHLQEKRIPANCDCLTWNWTFLSALSAGALGSQTTLNIRPEDIIMGHRGILVLRSYMSKSLGSDHIFQTSSHCM